MASEAGIEPATNALTVRYSTAELLRTWWRRGDLNPEPAACKADALPLSYVPDMVPRGGLEPPTPGFSDPRSTTELSRRIGAGKENRTPATTLARSRSTIELYPRGGGEGRTRTCEAMKRLIYSQRPLPLGSLPLGWLREVDLNHRPLGYEPSELTGLLHPDIMVHGFKLACVSSVHP